MYIEKQNYENDMEILYSNANLVTFSGTVLSSNAVQAQENGKKYVLRGNLIDKDGNIVTEKQSGTAPSITYSLSSVPDGVLYRTVEITHGDTECSLVVEGYLRADRVLDKFPNTQDAVKKALTKITFR